MPKRKQRQAELAAAIRPDQFEAFEKIRRSGKYNMVMDRVPFLYGSEVYWTILRNYAAIRARLA